CRRGVECDRSADDFARENAAPAALLGAADGRAVATAHHCLEAIPRQAGGRARCAFARAPRRERGGDPGGGPRPRIETTSQAEGARCETAEERIGREGVDPNRCREAPGMEPRRWPLPVAAQCRRHLRFQLACGVRSRYRSRPRRPRGVAWARRGWPGKTISSCSET